MAGSILNTYSDVDENIINVEDVLTQAFKGYNVLTLTHMADTTVPAITAGSCIEVNGSLIQFNSEEAISLIDPHTSATVANGYVYIIINGTTGLAYFTATAPTWNDAKQGWYGLTTWANWRYVCVGMGKATSVYSNKFCFNNFNYNIVNNIIVFTGTTDASAHIYIPLPPGYTEANTIILDAYVIFSGEALHRLYDGVTTYVDAKVIAGNIDFIFNDYPYPYYVIVGRL